MLCTLNIDFLGFSRFRKQSVKVSNILITSSSINLQIDNSKELIRRV